MKLNKVKLNKAFQSIWCVTKHSVLVAFLAIAMSACGGSSADPEQPSPPAIPDPVFPDALATGASCNFSCPNGDDLAITCAAGETPVCNCDVTPRTQCLNSRAQ